MSGKIHKRILDLQQYLEEKKLHAFIIPTTDPHLSEYPAEHWASREWISGFTGSAGTVVVTRTKAGLWTDSRYFLQANQELAGSGIDLFKEGLIETPTISNWLSEELEPGEFVGIDGDVFSYTEATELSYKLSLKGIRLISDYDPFSEIWKNRPAIPLNPLFVYPEKYAGKSASDKVKMICQDIKQYGTNAMLISSLDTIAWLFNIRGNDVHCNPVVVSYAFVSEKETVLFIDNKKLDKESISYLKSEGIIIVDYARIYNYIASLPKSVSICLQGDKVSFKLYNLIPSECRIVSTQSPADLMKSRKNEVELDGTRNAMQRDGIALVKFLMWFEKALKTEELEELSIVEKLQYYRSQQDLFVGDSFDTIAGFNSNGAIVHYHVTPESSAKLKTEGFILIDSGAQYFDGTTDITRTLALGSLTEQMKIDYTLVLKGHISIATSIYPEGTRGSQIDILARKNLWDRGLNFLHGTGHGVGHFLNVHEGPQNIRMNENPVTLQVGMITSNEPGLYRTNQYGIRIENLILTKNEVTTEFGNFFSFETLTLCPIDTTPIVKDMLTEKEITWFNNYHQYVYDRLSTGLNEEERKWLKLKTKAI